MSGVVTLPGWLAVLIVALAILALVNHFFLPAIRWFARRAANRVISDVNKRFGLKLPTFQLTERQVLIDRLVYDPEVLETVTRIAEERGVPRDGVMAEVVMFAREMVPSFNAYIYFRLGYRLARRLLRSFYHVNAGWVHEAAREQPPENTSVVFFINHRSNMDYLLVSYLASNRAALSYGAGEWARFWPFRPMLRLAGAYILRRSHNNPLYRIVLRRYVQMATAAGVPHAIFCEGELSRNGKVNTPKLGLLSYICHNFDPAGDREILFIPVGTNFDRVVEERVLVANRNTDFQNRSARFVLGSTLKFALEQVWRKATGQWQGFGVAAANFGKPVSLRAWAQKNQLSFAELEREQMFSAVSALGEELHQRITCVIPVLAVPLLAMVLLRSEGPLTPEMLSREALQELERLHALGAHAGMKPGEEERAILNGLKLMSDLNLVSTGAHGTLTANEHERDLLQYHANSIIQLSAALEAQ
jgi:glycerol-3-phosphate O-acyltransferase